MNESGTRKRHRSRPAFTLIEVLVVIVIISTVLALLGPKLVQTAEAARRTQCRNNLSQIVLAIHSYEGLHGVLPPGTINPHGPIRNVPDGYHVSWTIQLLPFLEQQNYYESIDPLFGAYNGVLNGGGSTIPVYTCPSSGVQIASTGAAVSSYAACYGDSETGIDSTNNGAFFLNSSPLDTECGPARPPQSPSRCGSNELANKAGDLCSFGHVGCSAVRTATIPDRPSRKNTDGAEGVWSMT